MFEHPDYEIGSVLEESANFQICHAKRKDDKKNVYLKTIRAGHPPPRLLAVLQHEYDLLKQLDEPDIIHALGYESIKHSAAIVLEEVNQGIVLQDLLNRNTLSVPQFLRVSINITKAINKIHRANIINKNINPDNIIVLPDGINIKILDFSIASLLTREKQDLTNPSLLEGTLAYISPEQTGRMNRKVDYRTDFYSLGVTFYYMLTGKLPFTTEDPMELVHCHIAKQPTSPTEFNPKIPEALSNVILKLMAKIPEERYQSATGIEKDLQTCLDHWEKTKNIPTFDLGRFDVVETFQISDKLYGRDTEVESLMNVFNTVANGTKELLFVPGYSGVGKTRLISEIHKPITEKRGYFISGKFEQFQQNIPYKAISVAFNELIRQLLSESPDKLSEWKKKIAEALSINGQVIVDLMPDLELIIGKQKPVAQLGPDEARARLFSTFEAFITLFANEEHPLVIFFDDLQWSNVQTLRLIQYLLTQSTISHLLIIGAYRDNEIPKGHPLLLVSEEIKKVKPIHTLQIKNLDKHHVSQLIADTLRHKIEDVKDLADIIYDKAKGNPFFTIELLKNLYQSGQFTYDHKKNTWLWDIDKIRHTEISDNVVDFLLKQINKLPQETQDVLQVAACCGSRADLKLLETLTSLSEIQLSKALWPALQNEIIIPLSTDYRLIALDKKEFRKTPELNVAFKFNHDRLQQASYQLMNSQERKKTHRKIALYLLSEYPKDELQDHMVDIVSQYNNATELIKSEQEAIKVAELNLQAAEKTKLSTAYDYSLKYLLVAKELMPEDSWQKNYELISKIYIELTSCSFLSGKLDLSKNIFEETLLKLRSTEEKAEIHLIQTMVHLTAGKLQESLQYALKGIAFFDLHYSEDITEEEFQKTKNSLEKKLQHYKIEELVDLPLLREPGIPILMELLSAAVTASFTTGKTLLANVCICKEVELSLEYGNSPQACVAYGTFGGVVLILLDGDIDRGYRFGKLAMNLNKKLDDVTLRCKVYDIYTLFCMFWKEHYSHHLESYKRAIDAGNLVGDKRYIGYACFFMNFWPMEKGVEFALEIMSQYASTLENSNFKGCILSTYSIRQFLQALKGQTKNSMSLTDENLKEESLLTDLLETKFKTGISNYYVLKINLCYMNEDYDEALKYCEKVEPMVKAFFPFSQPLYHIFKFLTYSASFKSFNKKKQKEILKLFESDLEKVKLWTQHCEENFLHLQCIMEGELARLNNRYEEALDYFDQAIRSAEQNGFVRYEALANELAAKMLIENNKSKIATAYMLDALYNYRLWGADIKVSQLNEYYGKVNIYLQSINQTQTTEAVKAKVTTSGRLDYLSILKALQSISSSLRLENLLADIITIMLENSGAQKGFLLLEKNKQLFIEAQANIDEKPKILHHLPLNQQEDLCNSIIQYVYRTKEQLVLNNALLDPTFGQDEYIQLYKPKSILCAPIKHKNELIGIFYFENNSLTNVFTTERLEVLELFASQAAISLENSRFYTVYERFVPKQFLKLLQKRSLVDVELGDSVEQDISILFTDLRNFTTLIQKCTPQEAFTLINRYWQYMAPVIRRHNGFIMHFLGDALMALFTGDADDALQASIGLLDALKEFNKGQIALGESPLEMGIGIATGPAMLGIIGEKSRLDQNIISDSTNTASRIEGLNKLYNTHILLSDRAKSSLKFPERFLLRRADKVILKGQANATYLYELIDWRNLLQDEVFDTYLDLFNQGFKSYETGDFKGAIETFKECLKMHPHDGVIKVLLERSQHFLTIPPTPDWDGTYIFQDKTGFKL